MDERLEELFAYEVSVQCRLLIAAADAVDEVLRAHARSEQYAPWRHLQTMLSAAATLSKLFWGSQSGRPAQVKEREARRAPLRAKFGVTDTSPFKETAVRNSFEHIDERLEDWYEKDPERSYFGRHIGAIEMIGIAVDGKPPPTDFQQFDTASCILRFGDDSIDMRAVLFEAKRILDLTDFP